MPAKAKRKGAKKAVDQEKKSTKGGKGSTLTPKQEAFCRAYIETGNASEAYRRAYDAEAMKSTAIQSNAKNLLRRTPIARRVDELRANLNKRHEITIDRAMQELAKIGFANMMDYVSIDEMGRPFCDLSRLTRDQAAAIHEAQFDTVLSSDPDAIEAAEPKEDGTARKKVTVLKAKIKLSDKRAALETIIKQLGGFEKDNRQKGEAAGEAAARTMSDLETARRVAFAMARTLKRQQTAPDAGSNEPR